MNGVHAPPRTGGTNSAGIEMDGGIKIGELIKRTGVTRATIHHYVREGLLPEPEKTSRNMALYDPGCIDRVLLIKGLQSQTRRSLSEVKTLLEDAADHEGIRKLQSMLEVEALRSQSSPLSPEGSRSHLTVKQLSERTGFSKKEIDTFHKLGLVNQYEKGKKKLIRPADVAVADALAALAAAGFDDEHGFKPEHAVIYLSSLQELLHKEVALFLSKTNAEVDPEDLLSKAELAITRVSPLMLAIRRKLIAELIEAAPISGLSQTMPDTPAFQVLIYTVSDHVCTITMNRPEKRNSLSAQLVNELIYAIETARDDAEVRAIVLTGAGGAFCSGADLSQMSGGGGEESTIPFRGGFVELNLAMRDAGKPIIARVERYALAGALALICNSTFVIAEDTAKFGAPEIDRGIFPMMVMASLFRTVPKRQGLEFILSGDKITAQAAVGMGLISRAVPSQDLDAEVAALASKLAGKAPAAIRLGLAAYHKQSELSFEEALPFLQDALMGCLSTEDAQEGVMAFLQKREPVWTGR